MSEYIGWGLACVFAVLYLNAKSETREALRHWERARRLADDALDVAEKALLKTTTIHNAIH